MLKEDYPDSLQSVLDSSISLIESMNMMPEDKDAKKFQWRIGGHSCFQAIMHIVSELETPEFNDPRHEVLKSRALAALQATVSTRGRGTSPTWNVITRIISNYLDKILPSSRSTLALSQTSIPRPETTTDRQSDLAAFLQQTIPTTSSAVNFVFNRGFSADFTGLDGLYTQNYPVDFDWVSYFTQIQCATTPSYSND
jgi:hypothetical protein